MSEKSADEIVKGILYSVTQREEKYYLDGKYVRWGMVEREILEAIDSIRKEKDMEIERLKQELHDKDILFNSMLEVKNGDVVSLTAQIGEMRKALESGSLIDFFGQVKCWGIEVDDKDRLLSLPVPDPQCLDRHVAEKTKGILIALGEFISLARGYNWSSPYECSNWGKLVDDAEEALSQFQKGE
jgi:hypothetical protein